MYKNILGVAAIVAATAVLIDSLPRAEAQGLGPVITGGEIPWVSFTGSVDLGDSTTVYTVPSDRVFVLTGTDCGFISGSHHYSNYCPSILEDSTIKVGSFTAAWTTKYGFLSEGDGHIKFEPGSAVVLDNSDGYYDAYYLMNGYLARP